MSGGSECSLLGGQYCPRLLAARMEPNCTCLLAFWLGQYCPCQERIPLVHHWHRILCRLQCPEVEAVGQRNGDHSLRLIAHKAGSYERRVHAFLEDDDVHTAAARESMKEGGVCPAPIRAHGLQV